MSEKQVVQPKDHEPGIDLWPHREELRAHVSCIIAAFMRARQAKLATSDDLIIDSLHSWLHSLCDVVPPVPKLSYSPAATIKSFAPMPDPRAAH
jgi:hypothetical protein